MGVGVAVQSPPSPYQPQGTRVASGSVPWGSGCLGHAGSNSQEALGPEGKKGLTVIRSSPTFKGYPFCAAGGPAETYSSWGRGDRGALAGWLWGGWGGVSSRTPQREGLWLLCQEQRKGSGRPGVLLRLEEGGQAGSSQALCVATAVLGLSPEPPGPPGGGDKPSTTRPSLRTTALCRSLTLTPCPRTNRLLFNIKTSMKNLFIYKFFMLGYKSISYTQECAVTSSS